MHSTNVLFTPQTQSIVCLPCATLTALRACAELLATLIEPGDILLLYGELGAGKTAFVAHLATALSASAGQQVASPTFALAHEYEGPFPIYHLDLYRLSGAEEIEQAGLLDYFDGQGLCLIEWPQRLGNLCPSSRLDIHFQEGPGGKQLVLAPQGERWRARLKAQLLSQDSRHTSSLL